MAIREKNLLKAMKKAAKKGGYEVLVEERDVMLFTEKWYIHMERCKVPRSVLALLVEHTGTIPEVGQSMQITAKEGAQMMAKAVSMESVEAWRRQEKTDRVVLRPVLYAGLTIFQSEKTGKCYGVRTASLEMLGDYDLQHGHGVVLEEERIFWKTENGNVILRAVRPTEDGGWAELKNVWQALESVQLK